MRKLDRYVSSYFLSSYGVCLLFFVGMFVLIDLFGKSDEVFDRAKDIAELGYSVGKLLARYYGLMIPFIFLQVAPFVTVMAAMFALTRLRRNNELVPMIVAGCSVYRILAPMFVFAVLLAGVMVMVQQFVAPGLADSREDVKRILVEGEDRRFVTGSHRCDDKTFVFVRDYDVAAKTIRYFDVSIIDSREPSTQGENARWNEERSLFVWDRVVRAEDGSQQTVLAELPRELTPEIIEAKTRGPYDLSYSQAQFLFDRTGEGKWKVLLHYHLTFPISNVLLLMLGVPFVLRHGRANRGLMIGMVVSIVICAAYFAFDAVMRNLGDKEVLHPVLAAWFGVIFFGSLGVVLVDSVKT